MAQKEFSREEIAKHNSDGDCWVIVANKVYDVSRFAGLHPGGEQLLLEYGGKDVTDVFYGLHRIEVLQKYKRLVIGKVQNSLTVDSPGFGDISNVPYAEPPFWRGMHSPYYTEKHRKYRAKLRKWLNENFREVAEEHETTNAPISREIMQKFGESGFFIALLGTEEQIKLAPRLPCGLKVEEYDAFYNLITQEEFYRLPCPGFTDGCLGGRGISAPLLLNFGNDWMKEIALQSLLGKLETCLAITEPFVGSDVAGLKTTAVKSSCGKYYIVNGVKKWITQGTYSDWFVTAVRTGGKAHGGISALLIKRSEGVSTKLIKTSYSTSAGTALVFFENVKVPVENLIGKENKGFRIFMHNFNGERFAIIINMIAKCRFVIEEAFKWANQRIIFGKQLIKQPVIQQKFAAMIGSLESCYAWQEQLTYQMSQMSFEEANLKLGGDIALLKFQATQLCDIVQREVVQIFGGRGVSKTGMGKYIERFQRTIKIPGVYGGAAEVMASLGVRLALRTFPPSAKL